MQLLWHYQDILDLEPSAATLTLSGHTRLGKICSYSDIIKALPTNIIAIPVNTLTLLWHYQHIIETPDNTLVMSRYTRNTNFYPGNIKTYKKHHTRSRIVPGLQATLIFTAGCKIYISHIIYIKEWQYIIKTEHRISYM